MYLWASSGFLMFFLVFSECCGFSGMVFVLFGWRLVRVCFFYSVVGCWVLGWLFLGVFVVDFNKVIL